MKRWIIGSLIILAVLVGVALFITSRVPSEAPIKQQESFPQLVGTNLKMQSVTVPADLVGDLRLVVVAYDTDQQPVVDKWLRPLEDLNTRYPQLTGYYLPLLPRSAADAAIAILGGMTLAAKDDRDRERTVVVFTDVPEFNALVDVPNTDEVHLFLLDTAGKIRWHGFGAFQPETLESLEAALGG